MGNRRNSRVVALDVLYEREVSAAPVEEILQRYANRAGFDFAAALVRGVASKAGEIDELISRHAKDWSLERMPLVDRSLLRMAVFELLELPDVPPAVSINEAVELAKIYSTEDSSRFVNGVLASAVGEVGSPQAGTEPF